MAAPAANGGSPPEAARVEVHEAVTEKYNGEGGRAAVINEITQEMGDGHEAGTKAQLIERLTTIRLLRANKTNVDDEKLQSLLEVKSSDDFDEGPEVDAPDDRTAWHFDAMKLTLEKVHELQQTMKNTSLSICSHELQYMQGSDHTVRGTCGVCSFTEQEEDCEGCQSTQLMCTNCRVWVCKASACLMAHLKHGQGRACTEKVWGSIEVADNQQQYKPAAAESKKRKENRGDGL